MDWNFTGNVCYVENVLYSVPLFLEFKLLMPDQKNSIPGSNTAPRHRDNLYHVSLLSKYIRRDCWTKLYGDG